MVFEEVCVDLPEGLYNRLYFQSRQRPTEETECGYFSR